MKQGLLGCLCVLLCLCVQAANIDQVQLVGIFKDTAVFSIAGKQRMLKVGQTSPEGVKLLSVEREQAQVRLSGQSHTLSFSKRITGGYQAKEAASHRISINARGQYITSGSIDGIPVSFLVDTGATSVAMNTEQARRLGIDFSKGQPQQVATAGGIVKAYAVTLERVKVGDIEVRNVGASVLEGLYPLQLLLGMTYLTHVQMSEVDGLMTLTQKY